MTRVQQACQQVAGFDHLYKKFLRRISINDLSNSTSTNYGRSLATLALHYQRLPTTLSLEEVEEYLYLLKQQEGGGSGNCFKFLIASLRFVYRMEGMHELRLKLPSIQKRRKLPVVLSKKEMTAMLNIPCMLKHRVMIAILYGCGLRCGEVRNVKVVDIDFDRALLHVRQGKGGKDRYVSIGEKLAIVLKKYISIQKPKTWLFPGPRLGKEKRFYPFTDPQYGQRTVQWAIKRAAQLAGITKSISVHSLRHTYATHLLEDGVNILTIKELLGHADIRTTMTYLHVAQMDNYRKCSPLDSLQGLQIIGSTQTVINFEE